MELRRTIVVAGAIIAAILVALLYGLVFIMSGGLLSAPLGRGPGAPELHFANAAFLILLILPVVLALLWLLRAPARIAEIARRRRNERGLLALEEALIASASGDTRTARRQARKAEELLERTVASRLVSAQAAEQMGDVVGAESHYAAMLADNRTELVGRRGLAAAALSRRDYRTAILHAAQAFSAHPGARWAFDLLFDAQVRAADWDDALETLAQGAKRKHLTDVAARRRRAVLLAAAAAGCEHADPARARDLAEQAASLSPAFAPAAALAARL
ncbi:MAG: hypothetical protein MI723_02595, partial [Caulobacterales bacterium]|nr:hypothetical protein [Caulobacterales bacterium]